MPEIKPTDSESLQVLARAWCHNNPLAVTEADITLDRRRSNPGAAAAFAADHRYSLVCTGCDRARLVCRPCAHHGRTWDEGYEENFKDEIQIPPETVQAGGPDGIWRIRGGHCQTGVASSRKPRSPLSRVPVAALDGELSELLASRPPALARFLTLSASSDVRHVWSSGKDLLDEFEAGEGKLPADTAFSVSSLWTVCLSRNETTVAKCSQEVIADRESTVLRHRAVQEAQPSQVYTFRKLVAEQGTPLSGSLVMTARPTRV